MKLSLKQLKQLDLLLDSIGFLLKQHPHTDASFYALVVIGEILSTCYQKMSDEFHQAVGKPTCERLQEMRDQYLTHSTLLSKNSTKVDVLKSLFRDEQGLQNFEVKITKIYLDSSLEFVTEKITAIHELEDDKKNQAKLKITDLRNSLVILQSIVENIGKPEFSEVLNEFLKIALQLSDTLNNAYREDLKNKQGTKTFDEYRKTEEFQSVYDKIEATSKHLFRLVSDIPSGDSKDLLHCTFNILKHLKNIETQSRRHSDPAKIALEKEENSARITEIADELRSLFAQRHDEASNLASKQLDYLIRWKIISITALFEENNIHFTREFKSIRNDLCHKFLDIDIEQIFKLTQREIVHLPTNEETKTEIETEELDTSLTLQVEPSHESNDDTSTKRLLTDSQDFANDEAKDLSKSHDDEENRATKRPALG